MIIEVRPTTVRYQAGVPVTLSVHIENVRNVIAGVSILVLGADPEWVDVTEPILSLFPGEARAVEVNMLLPESIPAGQRQITVQVTEINEPRKSVLVPVTVEVAERERLLLNLKPPLVRGGSRAELSLRAENQGNTVIDRPLHGRDDEARLRFSFALDRLKLAPGEKTRIAVKVESRRPFWGIPTPRMLAVHADARTPAEREGGAPLPGIGAQAAFLQRPRLTRAALSLAATPIVLLIVVGTAVLVVGAVLKHHQTELANKDARLVAVSDPDSKSPPTAACPCSVAGLVVKTTRSAPKTKAGSSPAATPKRAVTPAEGTEVSLYRPFDPVTPVRTMTTGVNGDWRMDDVTAGDYLVRVTARQRIPTWYPQAVDAAHATTVTVAGGVTHLRPIMIGIALGSITIALDVDDPSDVRVTVRLAPGSTVPGAILATAVQTDTPTVFQAENLPTPGRFVVVAEKEGYLMASIPVDLALGQQRDVDTLDLNQIPVPPTPVPLTPMPAETTTAPAPTTPPSATASPSPTKPEVSASAEPAATTPPSSDPTTSPSFTPAGRPDVRAPTPTHSDPGPR